MRRKQIPFSYNELRSRHQYCIAMVDIQRDVMQGRMDRPTYDRLAAKGKLSPHCDFPEDLICAAPSINEDTVMQAIREEQEKIAGG